MSIVKKLSGRDGQIYVPFEERTGDKSVVYFTRDLSPEGLKKIYEKVNGNLTGKIAVKLHTGEKNGPNIIPAAWVKELLSSEPTLKDATIVETNTYYEGDRYTTEQHRETLKVNGWTFCPVDIMDEEGTVLLPIEGGKWMKEMSHGSHMLNYDSMLVLTHFKGHTMGGFGGSNKNIGIGCADGRIGKKMDPHPRGQGDVVDRRRGVDGAHQRVHQSHRRSFRPPYHLYQRHAQYVGVLRLRRHRRPARRDPQRGHFGV
jgi:hypothetical protein